METQTTPQNRFMTPKQLEEEYSFSEANQAQMRMQKRIPYIKIGGYCKYDRIEIDKWLEQNAIEVRA